MFPQGLPDEYAFVTTFRFRKSSRKEDWYIWQVIDQYGIPQVRAAAAYRPPGAATSCTLLGGGGGVLAMAASPSLGPQSQVQGLETQEPGLGSLWGASHQQTGAASPRVGQVQALRWG